MLYRAIGFTLLLLALAAMPAQARTPAPLGDDVPAWLKQAAAASAPAYDKDVPAVVLHDEGSMSISESGQVTRVTSYAVRILTREGRALASATEHYDSGSGKVRELRAWLIRPDGSVKKYGKEQLVDMASDLSNLYDEVRVQQINAAGDAEIGAVFGYQAVAEERAMFPQTEWLFQGRLPTLLSRYTVTLPASWRASGITFNTGKVEPVVQGNSYTWELRNLPPIEPEAASPTVSNLAPRLAVNFTPASAGVSVPGGRAFEKWLDVSKWYSELADPQAAPDDALAAKARELTAGAKTELEKIQAIGRFVQSLQYVSIQIGIGGYRPHAATEVFAKKYGDCKDKANLMRAMLRAVKIEAYPVLIYSGDRTYVREEWASPQQFNHCIIAVRVGDETQAPSIIQHASLGRLLIFDATDDSTPVGDLPDHEQGSFALIAAGDAGALMRMPVTPPEANRWERTTEVNLAADGSITAILRDLNIGQSAVRARRIFNGRSRPDFVKVIEHWISTGGATGAKLSKVEPVDNHPEGRFALDVEFTAERYAQSMQGSLLVFKPAVVSASDALPLGAPTRKHPVVLESRAFTETVRFKLPAGFEVDEIPEALKLDSAFGTYSATFEVKDGQLVFTRSLVQRAATIPADQYKQVRDFFGRIRAVEQSPIVLARK